MLKTVLTVDVNNTAALSYLEYIQDIAKDKKAAAKERNRRQARKLREEEMLENAARDEAIVPTYREGNGNWLTVLLLLIGIMMGALSCYFLVLPVREKALHSDFNEDILSYNEKIAERDTNISGLEDQINSLKEEMANLNNELAAYTGEGGIINEYNKLLDVLTLKANGDYIGAMDAVMAVNASLVTNEKFQSIYGALNAEFTDSGVQTLFNRGKEAYDNRDWETARVYFAKCLELQSDYPEVIFYMGICYQNQGDWGTAVSYYNQLIDNETYKDTQWGAAAKTQRGY